VDKPDMPPDDPETNFSLPHFQAKKGGFQCLRECGLGLPVWGEGLILRRSPGGGIVEIDDPRAF
jgi:hypothetical protein